MKRILLCASVMALLAACAHTGIKGLEADGTTARFAAERGYGDVASCTIKALDEEPWALSELALPANRVRSLPDSHLIEIANLNGGVFLYRVRFIDQGSNSTQIEVLARKDVNPYLSNHYVSDKLRRALAHCGATEAGAAHRLG